MPIDISTNNMLPYTPVLVYTPGKLYSNNDPDSVLNENLS